MTVSARLCGRYCDVIGCCCEECGCIGQSIIILMHASAQESVIVADSTEGVGVPRLAMLMLMNNDKQLDLHFFVDR